MKEQETIEIEVPRMNMRRITGGAINPRRVSADGIRQAPRIGEKRREHQKPDEQTNSECCAEVEKIQSGRSDWQTGGVQIPIPEMIQCQGNASSRERDHE